MINYSKKHLYRSSENWICILLFTAWIPLQHKLFLASSFLLVTLLHLALSSEWSHFQSFPSIVIAFCQLKKLYYLTVNHEVIIIFFENVDLQIIASNIRIQCLKLQSTIRIQLCKIIVYFVWLSWSTLIFQHILGTRCTFQVQTRL